MSVSRQRWRSLAVFVVVALVLAPVDAFADRRNDERTELVRRQSLLVQEMNELAASDTELAQALGTLDLWMAVQIAEVERTQFELAEATIAAERAASAEAAKMAEVENLEGLMAEMAINAYVQPPSADYLATMNSSAAPADAARLVVYLDVKAQRDTDLVKRLRQAREQLSRLRERARNTEARAQGALDDASSTLADLAGTRKRYAEIQREVQARHRGAEYESIMVGLDLKRSNDLLAAEAAGRRTSGIPMVNVGGIRVHQSIAGQIELLLAAANEDGVRLGGGGFRTHEDQIRLRRLHCGDDPYAIYEMPPGECSPPTARPGNSMHEIGLAIDFTYNGAIIGSHNNPGFRWLAKNAHFYGLYNLPSEPWHWSINGS